MSEFFINLSVDTEKRFDMSKFMEFGDCFDPLNSYLFNNIKTELVSTGTYIVSGEDGRPDLISHRIYGDTQYWWLIMLYNSIVDPFSVKTGDVLAVPSISSMEDLYFTLKSKSLETANL